LLLVCKGDWLVDASTFCALAEALTGTPVKDLTGRDEEFLTTILADDNRPIDCSQLNELLLLVNKDRLEPPFFRWFFGTDCRVSSLQAAVERFQRTAMLCYGNFIYAFRTLSRITTDEEFRQELGDHGRTPEEALGRYKARSPKLLEVDLIPRASTPLVGYLSATEITAELGRAGLLQNCLKANGPHPTPSWEALGERIRVGVNPNEHPHLLSILANYRRRYPGSSVDAFADYLKGALSQLEQQFAAMQAIRKRAIRNQDIYLTWDHMDVYFATSMRKRWEFEDLFDFVSGLMSRPELADLNLRYFDPTQSYTDNRVNKGLVESLMLKRAQCTVYSVQDTDTLGKDSELAATLAQGKPVIGYVPEIFPEARTGQLVAEDPVAIQERLNFVLYADEYFAASLSPEDLEFVRGFRQLERFEQGRIWRSVPDAAAVAELRGRHGEELTHLCRLIATSEARVYAKRARTLRDSHPLAIQVNLDTGVANGVLVVRNIPDCARLLRGILTNSLEFDLDEDLRGRMWYLREKITGCAYRVVSKDRKLTNCFWNFYRRAQS
jgi:hypothetical protein